MKLGIRKVVIASSETTYGVCSPKATNDFRQLSARGGLRHRSDGLLRAFKVVNEKTARAFAMRFGIDIYALRIAQRH